MEELKPIILLSILLISTSSGTAQDYNVRDTCQVNEESLFSMADRSGGHAAEPGAYKWQVCAQVEEAEFSQDCSGPLNSILALYKDNNSHVSTFGSYKWKVCATVTSEINNSCEADDRIVSLAKEDNSHVAEPGELPKTLCSSGKKVNTITLEMEMEADQVYVDGETAEEREYKSSELEFPYIVSDQPAGIVNYGETRTINYSENGTKDIMRLTQTTGTFLVPNTRGGYTELEDRQELVNQGELLQVVEPSFGFSIPEEKRVRVIFHPSTNLIGFNRNMQNDVELLVRNRVDGNSQPDIILEPD